jgi:Ca2+-binding EF-hand superfamily protein
MGNSISQDEIESLQEETSLSGEQIKLLSKEFSKVSDRRGNVSKENFKKIVQKVFGSDNSALVTSVFKMFDTDGSGAIDFREFVLGLSYLHSNRLEDVVELTFRCLDLNGDGSITKAEMRECFQLQQRITKFSNLKAGGGQIAGMDSMRGQFSEGARAAGEADVIFEKMDTNGDGSITKDEFLAALQSDPQLKAKFENLMMRSAARQIFSTSYATVAQ